MSYKNMSLLGPPLLDLEQREHAVKEDMEPSNLFLTAAGFAFSDERRAFTHRQGEQMAATPASKHDGRRRSRALPSHVAVLCSNGEKPPAKKKLHTLARPLSV